MAMDRKTSLLLIPLIIAIVAIIGLIAAIVTMNSSLEKEVELKVAAERQAEKDKENRATTELERQKLAMFITGNRDADPSLLRSRYLARSPVTDGIIDFLSEGERQQREWKYLTELYDRVFSERIQCLQKAKESDREAEAAQEDLRKQVELNRDIKEKKEAELVTIRAEKRQVETDLSNLQQQFKAMQARMQAQIEQLRTEMQEAEKKNNIEVAALRSEISEKKRRIQELIKKEPQTMMWVDPDGEIVLADNKLGNCWVDLGRRDGLRVGSVFEVFRYIKGGRRKEKGRIEIKKIENDLSQAAIIESLDPEDDPIVKGDHIISPFFDKHEVKEFVFAGELVNPLYSKQEVVKMIEEMGGKVAPPGQLSVETDFLIAGKGAEETEEYARAIDLGITVLREEELFKYLGK
jgi:hypothetical protein